MIFLVLPFSKFTANFSESQYESIFEYTQIIYVSITEIALNWGFSSSQHLSTVFKRSTGYQPSDSRKGKHKH
jgi:AraC-like DNA-binding protein